MCNCAQSASGCGIPSKKLFIVGCPRSGTTMVQQALNRHSQIIIPPETKYFLSFVRQSRKQQLRHIERLNADLGIRLDQPAGCLRTVPECRAFYEGMVRQYVVRCNKAGLIYFGDKAPEHTGHLPCIRALFPKAKIIVLIRDGRDVAVSLSRMPWMSSDLYVSFLVWLYYARVIRGLRASAWPNLYFARYENIVAAPAKEFGRILDFLGLPFEPAVSEGWGNHEGIPPREYSWKGRALERITTERVGVFKRELCSDQIDMLERIGRKALIDFGYSMVTKGNRPLSLAFRLKLGWNLGRFIWRLPFPSLGLELLNRFSPEIPQLNDSYPKLISERAGRMLETQV